MVMKYVTHVFFIYLQWSDVKHKEMIAVIQNVRTYRYDNIEQEKLRNRVTVDELLREDPRNQTVSPYT